MLVLTRKVDQTVRIGDDITIVVTRIDGEKVRLGIDAPKDISVNRGEIYDQMQQEKEGRTEE